jgi:hypothetical protein
MEKELSIISESDFEKSDSKSSSISMSKIKNNEYSKETEINYDFLKNFHQAYDEKKKNLDHFENEKSSLIKSRRNSLNVNIPKKNLNYSQSLIPSSPNKTKVSSNSPIGIKKFNQTRRLSYSIGNPKSPTQNVKLSNSSNDLRKTTMVISPSYLRSQKFSSRRNSLISNEPDNKKISRRFTITANQPIFKLEDISEDNTEFSTKNNTFVQTKAMGTLGNIQTTNENQSSYSKRLTLDKIVQDFNKPYLTFIKRRSAIDAFKIDLNQIKQNPVSPKRKATIQKKTSSKTLNKMTHKNLTSLKSGSFKNPISSSISDNSLCMDNTKIKQKKLSKRIDILFKRLKIHIHVIAFIAFTRKEIITYGIKSKSRIPFLDPFNQPDTVNLANFTTNENLLSMRRINLHNDEIKLNVAWYIIFPENPFYRGWKVMNFLVLFYFSSFGTFRVSFTDTYLKNGSIFFLIFDNLIEVVFLLDVVFNFLLAYYDSEGNIIVSFKSIMRVYISSFWAFLDILCLMAFFYSEFFILHSSNYNVKV